MTDHRIMPAFDIGVDSVLIVCYHITDTGNALELDELASWAKDIDVEDAPSGGGEQDH